MTLLYKPLYHFYCFLSGIRYHSQRRFTPAGLVVLLACLTSAAIGIDTENSLTYQLFALLFGLLLASAAGTLFFRVRISAVRLMPRFGTVGQPIYYRIRFKNLSSRRQNGLTILENLADPRPSFKDWLTVQFERDIHARSFRRSAFRRTNPFKVALPKEASVPPALPNQDTDVRVELTPLRRGLLRFAGLTVARTDPLGLTRALCKVELPQNLLILPKRYRLPPIHLPGTVKYQRGGVALASNIGRSEDFVALRDYRQGDPLRHIHWRSWAKAGRPVVKEFEDEFFVRHALILDTFLQQSHGELFEEAVAVAASFAYTLDTQDSLLDLLFVGADSYSFTAGRGLAHADQMLEILAAVRPCREKSFSALEHLLLNHVNLVSGCIFVLLAWDEARRGLVNKITTLGIPSLVLVIVSPGQGGSLDSKVTHPERFHALEVGQIERQLARLS